MEAPPRYRKNIEHVIYLKELHQRVRERLNQLPPSRMNMVKFNLFFLPAIYFSLYILALTYSANYLLFLLLYALMGLMTVVIFCELIHELCHNNVFRSKKLNSAAFMLFDLLGANSYIWRLRHLRSHHRYPNVQDWDTDIEQKGPIAVYHDEDLNEFIKYQNIYVFFLYPLFMINWLLVRDFRDYFAKDRIANKRFDIPRIEYFKLFFFKILYIFLMVGVPRIYGDVTLLESFFGLVVLTVSGSMLAMIVLLTPHVNEGNEFPVPNEAGEFENSWFMHQLNTTNDLTSSNWFTRYFMGNFNYHLIHHFFPNISAVYAPEVTEVIKEFLREHDLPYKAYSIRASLWKHFQLIRRNAMAMRK